MYTRRLAKASRNSPIARRSPIAQTRCCSSPSVASAVGLVASMCRETPPAISPRVSSNTPKIALVFVRVRKFDPDEVVRALRVKAVALLGADHVVRWAQEVADRFGLLAVPEGAEGCDVGHVPILGQPSDDNSERETPSARRWRRQRRE